MNSYIRLMTSARRNSLRSVPEPTRSPPLSEARDEAAWRVFPMEGAFELAYHDEAGNPSTRYVIVRELKVGPGKTLLGGIDMSDEGYRGFRADRIQRMVDAETGQTVDRNILDWLIKRASTQAKERRKALAKVAKERRTALAKAAKAA